VIHGGPSIPSNYLLPVVNGVTDRAIVYYDQWGCGKSSRPQSDKILFSISTMVNHLQLLIRHWDVPKFHLLGHSFGGIIAYEYLKKNIGACQSLILASTPTSPNLIQQECQRLNEELLKDDNGTVKAPTIKEEEEQGTTILHNHVRQHRFSDAFLQTHECRLPEIPLVLTDALAQAGPVSWRGIQAIIGYEATETLYNIPTLLLVGEFDFCTPLCIEKWKEIIQCPSPLYTILKNCSHYGMLEDEGQYGKAIVKFLHGTE
jgi:proline-specific peptidase